MKTLLAFILLCSVSFAMQNRKEEHSVLTRKLAAERHGDTVVVWDAVSNEYSHWSITNDPQSVWCKDAYANRWESVTDVDTGTFFGVVCDKKGRCCPIEYSFDIGVAVTAPLWVRCLTVFGLWFVAVVLTLIVYRVIKWGY